MESVEFYIPNAELSAPTPPPIVGQYFDQDLIGTTGQMLTGFYESGQLWALLIGIVIGYIFKSAFSYG